MIINTEGKWLYIGPPKTGSTSLHSLLSKPPFYGAFVDPTSGSDVPEQHNFHPPAELLAGCDCNYIVAVSSRNPYSRAVSLWLHCCNQAMNIPSSTHKLSHPLLNFPNFVDYLLDVKKGSDTTFFSPQYKYLSPTVLAAGFRPIHLEDIRSDLSNFFRDFAIEVPTIPVSNSTRPLLKPDVRFSFHWTHVYDFDLVKKVQNWAGDDFDRFGYSPDFKWSMPKSPTTDIVVEKKYDHS